MTLGEKITALRTAQKLSQGDLAEKLDVSRQSVSKWETGASVPELDKLIAISELFNISLDELVKSEEIPEEPAESFYEAPNSAKSAAQDSTDEPKRSKTQSIGYKLFGAGILSLILGIAISDLLFAIGICLVVYGLICITVKKHAGLVCGWLSLLPFLFIFVRVLGIGFGGLFDTDYGVGGIAGISIVLFALLSITMIVLTVRAYKNNKKS